MKFNLARSCIYLNSYRIDDTNLNGLCENSGDSRSHERKVEFYHKIIDRSTSFDLILTKIFHVVFVEKNDNPIYSFVNIIVFQVLSASMLRYPTYKISLKN